MLARRSVVLWVALLLPVVGCLWLPVWTLGIEPHIPRGTWERVATPPGGAAQILGYNFREVYVKTRTGAIYACDENTGSCRLAVELLPSPPDPCPWEVQALLIPDPPGTAVDRRQFQMCGVDVRIQMDFAALADGSVWKCRRFQSANIDVLIIPLSMISGLMGAVAGTAILLLIWWIERRASAPPKW